MNKKKAGQLELSFSMIFSILIIIVTVAVAFYFIQKFLTTSACVNEKLFYKDLQEKIDAVWRSPLAQQYFSGELSRSITQVCFGNVSAEQARSSLAYAAVRRYANTGSNFFLYPPNKACDESTAHKRLLHVHEEGFFCTPVVEGKTTLGIAKATSTDALVTITEP